MRITVVGTGYVGLVSAVGFAELGHRVTCVDIDHGTVDAVQSGTPPFFEPGLQEALKAQCAADRIDSTLR